MDLGALSAPCRGLSAGGKLQMPWGVLPGISILYLMQSRGFCRREEKVDLLWDLDWPTYRIWSPGEKGGGDSRVA